MATRMTTLLYGEKPEIDVEPGNRVDSEDGPSVPAPPPMRPPYPMPSPWVRREAIAASAPRGLRAILGVAAASLVAACLAYVAKARRVTA
jgi:hypothetical protein